MDASCLTRSSNGIFSHAFNHIAGEDECARTCSSYRNAFPNRTWVTDLSTSNYELLETDHDQYFGFSFKQNSNEPEKELAKKLDVFDQLEAQWAEVKEQLEQECSSMNETVEVVKAQDDFNSSTDVNIFKANDYFELLSSSFDDLLSNQEIREQNDGLRNVTDNTESELKLFKAEDYFEPQPSPFDDFLPIKEHRQQSDRLGIKKSNNLFSDEKNKESEITLFKGNDS